MTMTYEKGDQLILMIIRIKCRLGYAELHKPAPGFGPGETEVGIGFEAFRIER